MPPKKKAAKGKQPRDCSGANNGNYKITPEMIDDICGHIIDGRSLRKILAPGNEYGITYRGLFKALTGNEEYEAKYVAARAFAAELEAELLVELADEIDGAESPVEVSAMKLRLDARKWVASRLLPKKYGDRVQTEHSGKVETTSPTFSLNLTGK